MGILGKFSVIVRSKLNSVLNRAEDPTEQLDYSYEKLQDELQEVQSSITDVTTQKKRLESQRDSLMDDIEVHNKQSRSAVKNDREDLARKQLEKKNQKLEQVEKLEADIDRLEDMEQSLLNKKSTLRERIDEFKTEKEMLKARQTAAEAQVDVQETLSGVGENSVGTTIEEMRDEIESMEARSEALDELEESDTFDSGFTESSLDKELAKVTVDDGVEEELEQLKNMKSSEGSSE